VVTGRGAGGPIGAGWALAGCEAPAWGEVVWKEVGGAPAGGVEPGGAELGAEVPCAIAAAPAPSVRANANALPNTAIRNPSVRGLSFLWPAKPE
jgi:hypothetical protein